MIKGIEQSKKSKQIKEHSHYLPRVGNADALHRRFHKRNDAKLKFKSVTFHLRQIVVFQFVEVLHDFLVDLFLLLLIDHFDLGVEERRNGFVIR